MVCLDRRGILSGDRGPKPRRKISGKQTSLEAAGESVLTRKNEPRQISGCSAVLEWQREPALNKQD
jgi:hypothetical protein